jgi:DNA-nicking Smr family endonuclease
MKRRAIDPDESALWHDAMRGVARHRVEKKAVPESKQLSPEKISVVPAKAGTQGNPPSLALDSRLRGNDGNREIPHEPTPGLDRRQALRLKRGQLEIEARLDLHGMTQAEAHRALSGFVARSHAAGKRTLLVVTGKGTREGTGVLRAAVPRWLAEPALRDRVLATAPAQPRDGGSGALYILLRRAR